MLNYIDRKFKLDVQITFIATFISIVFITSTFIWEEQALHILSILVVLLPVIYVIGNLIIRGILDREMKDLRQSYDDGLLDVNDGIEEMKLEIERLREENRNLRNGVESK